MSLKNTFSKLKRNKKHTKQLLVELMKISSIDFSTEHAEYKLYKYKFSAPRGMAFKWMMELCDEQVLIFNGYKPDKVDGETVGFMPVFGLIKH